MSQRQGYLESAAESVKQWLTFAGLSMVWWLAGWAVALPVLTWWAKVFLVPMIAEGVGCPPS